MSENVFIVQPVHDDNAQALQAEAVALIESAGASYAGTMSAKIREVNPATYLGEGKIAELRAILEGLDVTVLFNGELSPSQTVNLSEALGGKKVIDRTTLILDIFALRAESSEGKLQVELAQLRYLYPRLKGKGEALSRLGAARSKKSWKRRSSAAGCRQSAEKKTACARWRSSAIRIRENPRC